jgi:hypothetical protein
MIEYTDEKESLVTDFFILESPQTQIKKQLLQRMSPDLRRLP